MAKKTRHYLELGMPFISLESDRYLFEVCPGRWNPPTKDGDSECAVIVQERRRGPLKSVGVFKMAIDPDAVEAVVEGLQKWLAMIEGPECFCGFPAERSQLATVGPLKACGSGPGRPSPQMFERSELGDGRLGEPLAEPADGLPEA